MNEKTVTELKMCAETIIKNARSIVGDEEYQGELRVIITINDNKVPTINIDRDIYPEKLKDYYKNN